MISVIMIQVLYKDGRSIPLMMCDLCGEPIRDASMAMVAYEEHDEEDQNVTFAFLHKNECDMSYKGGQRRKGGWVELRHFLVNLLHNTGLQKGEKLDRAIEGAEELSQLG